MASPFELPLWRKVCRIAAEQLYCTGLLVRGAVPFLYDLCAAPFRRGSARLPRTVEDVLRPECMGQLLGKQVASVQRSRGLEQHANSTDREWLRVDAADGEVIHVFAKTRARNPVVCAMMSIFDVYRNELHALAEIPLPVPSPKVYCARWSQSRFVVLMQDLSRPELRVDFPNIWREPPCSAEQARAVLRMYARLHAHFYCRVPDGVWDERRRPYFGKALGLVTLRRFCAQTPGVIPDAVRRTYALALWHWDALRAAWTAAAPKTLVHGDAHFGNMYLTPAGEVGIIDLQCVAEEHPMRDVTYFLASGYPSDRLAADEEGLLRYYLDELAAELRKRGDASLRAPTYAEAYEQYRLQSFYAMYAFVFSQGAGNNLMDSHQGRVGVGRIAALMQRIDADRALHRLLSGGRGGSVAPPQ